MTPFEINTKIAELKGITNAVEHTPHALWMGCSSECKKYYEPEINYNLNWSEELLDAWKLFEEMGKENDSSAIFMNKDGTYNCTYLNGPFQAHNQAGTASEAICLAWIKWKESL